MKFSYRNEKNARFISAYYHKPLDKPDWYKVEAVSDDDAEILLYDFIGWPFNEAGEFIRLLSGLTQKNIVIRINSPGGDVWDANAIYNAIKAHPSKPTTRIESIAASAASYIAVAGSQRQAYKNTMGMIHEPMVGFFGNQYEIEDVKSILSQISDIMIDMYADNTNVGKRELKDMMKVETWMNAKAMKEKGFIDTIIEAGKPVKAQFDLSMYANAPDFLSVEPNNEPTQRQIEKVLRDAGLSKNKAQAVLAGGWKALSGEQETQAAIESAQKIINLIGGNRNG
jgi:ATP-dependent protease ClpP protease subunit